MKPKTTHRETMIALRAARTAIDIARKVTYPRIDCGPHSVSEEWIAEHERRHEIRRLREAEIEYVPIEAEYLPLPTNEDVPAPKWLVVFLVFSLFLVAAMVVGVVLNR